MAFDLVSALLLACATDPRRVLSWLPDRELPAPASTHIPILDLGISTTGAGQHQLHAHGYQQTELDNHSIQQAIMTWALWPVQHNYSTYSARDMNVCSADIGAPMATTEYPNIKQMC